MLNPGNHRRARRVVAVVLMVVGGALMALSPDVGAGLAAFALGLLLELVGLALEHRPPR
jgi:hypothetical protein